MLKENTKVKLVKPKNDNNWPKDIEHIVGKTCYIVSQLGSYQGGLCYIVRSESERFSFAALEEWLQPLPELKQVACPLCGWPGELGFNLVYCSNHRCQNGRGYGMEERV